MFTFILQELRPAIVLLAALSLLTGLAYPYVIIGLAQVLFPWQANGSLILEDGKIVGSDLIAQSFTSPAYFHGRPSAAGAGYDGASSSGSNLGPTSAALIDRVKGAVEELRRESPAAPIPADLVTASGSGLDPHISPEAAARQAARIAEARGLAPERVRALIAQATEGRTLGILGEPRVNVLRLNRLLDQEKPLPPTR